MNPISALDGRKIFSSSIHFTRKLKKIEAIHIGVVLSSALYLVFCTAECRSTPPASVPPLHNAGPSTAAAYSPSSRTRSVHSLFNKKCSSCSLAQSTHLTAAAPCAGLLGLHLGPRLLARGFARVQQDQTWGAVPGRQSEGAGQRKRSRLSPPTTTSRPWPESRLGESGRPDELANRRRHFVLAANSSAI